jgi:hypothetical protein
MQKTKFRLVCVVVLVCAGCRGWGRYFWTESGAIKHFTKNENLFDQAAARWVKQGASSFSLDFGKDAGFTWDDFRFTPHEASYDVVGKNGKLSASLTFDQAASLAGISPDELRWWIQTSRQLQVCRVLTASTGPPLSARYVRMYLRGSAEHGYGFIYLPPSDARGLRGVTPNQLRVGSGPYLSRLDFVGKDWRYFEESGPSSSPEPHRHPGEEEEK